MTCDGTGITNGRQEVIVGQIHGPGGTPPIIICVNHKRGGALELSSRARGRVICSPA
jgi:hypothetical protein